MVPDMAPAPAMTGLARPGTTTGVRPVLPWAVALAAWAAAALAAVPAAAALAAEALVEAVLAADSAAWAAAPAMAAAVDADGDVPLCGNDRTI